MKSRFEVMQSPVDRRALALLRSSSAIGVVLTLLGIGSFLPSSHGPHEAIRSDLWAMEIGDPAVAHASGLEFTPSAPRWTAALAETDEFALPPGDTAAPVGH